jgi:hypothetical protein
MTKPRPKDRQHGRYSPPQRQQAQIVLVGIILALVVLDWLLSKL